ncbi:hypothetical protein [Sporosarcina sp. P33]|uniref:hypothetical protein n=1 Tax=Sporosarcina sp. P33 TaxID=1930764 RepID=UPI0018C8C579|nr:hypothetical protein [Sporosarcina sp. P33]
MDLIADKTYYNLFQSIKHYLLIFFLINIIFLFITEILNENYVVYPILLIMTIFMIIWCVIEFKKLLIYFKNLRYNYGYYFITIILLGFIIMLGIAFSAQSKSLLVEFGESNNYSLILSIESENFKPENIHIEYLVNNEKNEQIKNRETILNSKDFRYGYIQNTQELREEEGRIKKDKKTAVLNNSFIKYIYEDNIYEYLTEGENFVVFTIEIQSLGTSNYIKIFNQIHKDKNGELKITKDKFEWKGV